jgi:UDP-N-acetylmuramate: L-alanyl-gamma-D-glutamyl-meso-diaminopimelate ligase
MSSYLAGCKLFLGYRNIAQRGELVQSCPPTAGAVRSLPIFKRMTESPTPPQDNGNILARVAPGSVSRIHLVGVGGTGMGSFAGLLKAAGYEVTGSDQNVYPPMSDMLVRWGVEIMTPYAAQNLDRARPDLVVIGNVIRRVNPEATAVRERGMPQMSFPAAMGSLILDSRHSIVVAGTHGKTTTSALLSHVLVVAGTDPTFLVGGVTLNAETNFRFGQGSYAVVEGDEYDTAYFDKGPKFLHYRARTAMLTSIEFDHADIYRDMEHYESAYARFAETIPADGALVVCSTYPNAERIAREYCKGRVITYAGHSDADYAARNVVFSADGATFEIARRDDGSITQLLLPMSGRHNVENAVGVFAVAMTLGLAPDVVAEGFATFKGVKRRQEVKGEVSGVLVVDDFAHHPTAVQETIDGIRDRYSDRRVIAVFEPRSNTSRRDIHQFAYVNALREAPLVYLKVPEPHDKVPVDQQLNVNMIVEDLKTAGVDAHGSGDVAELVGLVAAEAREGDLVLVMSNGAFGGFVPSLMETLRRR